MSLSEIMQDAEKLRALAEDMQGDYKRLASLAKRLASSIAGKGGAFLSSALCEEVQQAIENVQVDRRRVQHCAEVFQWEQVPEDFETLGREVARVEAEARAQAIADAAAPFLALVSDDAKVRAALVEAQATLKKTLKLRKKFPTHGDAAESVARLKETLQPYQTFVQALRSQDGAEKLACLRVLMGTAAFSDVLLGALLVPGKLSLAGEDEKEDVASASDRLARAPGASDSSALTGSDAVAATTQVAGTSNEPDATQDQGTNGTDSAQEAEQTRGVGGNATDNAVVTDDVNAAANVEMTNHANPADDLARAFVPSAKDEADEELDEEAKARAEKELWDHWSAEGLLLPEGYDYGELQTEMLPKGTAKAGAKAFTSDFERLTKLVRGCARNILMELDDTHYIDRDYAVLVGKEEWTPEVYDAAFDRLLHLGCIRSYTLAGCGTFYMTTPKMEQLLGMERVRSYLNLPKRAKHLTPRLEVDDKTALAAVRLAFTKIHAHHARALAEARDEALGVDIAGTVGAAVMGADEFRNGVHMAVYWFAGEDTEADESPLSGKHTIDKILSHKASGALRDLTLVGMERSTLTCLLRALRKAYPQIKDVSAYYYLLPEDAFYDSAWEPAPDWFGLDAREEDADVDDGVDADEEEGEEEDDAGVREADAQDDALTTGEEQVVASGSSNAETEQHEDSAPLNAAEEDSAESVPSNAGTEYQEEPIASHVETEPHEEALALTADNEHQEEPLAFEESGEPATQAFAPVDFDDSEAVLAGAVAILARGHLPAAAAYLGFCARVAPEVWEVPYQRLASAVDDPACPPSHGAGDLFALFTGTASTLDQYLAAAAAVRAYFSNDVPHDYDMQRFQAGCLDGLPLLERCTPLKNLLHKLMDFKAEKNKGMDFFADYRRKDQKARAQQRRQIQHDAQGIYDTRIIGHIKENVIMKRFHDTKKYVYRKDGDFAKMLLAVLTGDNDGVERVAAFVDATFCDAPAGGRRTVSPQRVDDYIDAAWDAVRNSLEKRSDKLTSKLRSSFHGEITNVADVLCRWADFGQMDAEALDDADYQRAKSGVLEDLHTVAEEEGARLAASDDVDERAGIEVLFDALKELEERLGGSYEPSRKRYWYIDFLRSTQLLLDENDLPDYRAWYLRDPAAHYLAAVQAYAATEPPTFEARLDEIFTGGDDVRDDYQTARLIDAYLTVQSGTSYLAAHGYHIEKNAPFAEKQARRIYDRFEEELEFAQSCGQITSTGSDENKKESILALMDDCYRYAQATQNYGVFFRTVKAFQAQIKDDARAHGAELQKELDACKGTDLDAPHAAFLDAIQKTIDAQNYTVAEDMLRRFGSGDIDLAGTRFDEGRDPLRRFLQPRNYSDTYRRVSDGGTPLAKLLGSSSYVPHNKKGRGAQELSKNWIKNPMDGDQMKRLLSALGWDARSATLLSEDTEEGFSARGSKQIVFRVTLEPSANHARTRYQHPIAIFGSEAERDGFRAVCLFGQYDADNLVATCSRLSATLHTIIFLDYALDLKQRRRLARKMKEARLGKTYAVVDRVVIAYLFRNYDEIQVNRMLMMLIMPFAACQPYVPDSGQPMPPEMFMGRKEDLLAVESPEGVNIVYGGRQLGKSALLKMAQNDIDHDEAGDRAILIDLHDCKSTGAAALAVSQELTDLRFFKAGQGVETEDWSELARAITQRLRDPVDRIPYFLLMLDEADAFIEQCAAENYAPFDALKRVQQNGSAQFKFVIAGLHNIVRFSKAALGENSVLAHLTHCTVKPFRVSEARELLETPLRYLGFRFPENASSLITLILAHANYFPGLIQLYCKELIRALAKEDYAHYDETKTPPYEITRDHVRAVLTNRAFQEQVREKFMITLRLDSDKYYYIIAYLLASLYHKAGSRGFTPAEIAHAAEAYDFEQFRTLSRERLTAFLDELTELNVLRGNAEGRYFFNRYSFFQMLGSKDDVEEKLYALALGEEDLA